MPLDWPSSCRSVKEFNHRTTSSAAAETRIRIQGDIKVQPPNVSLTGPDNIHRSHSVVEFVTGWSGIRGGILVNWLSLERHSTCQTVERTPYSEYGCTHQWNSCPPACQPVNRRTFLFDRQQRVSGRLMKATTVTLWGWVDGDWRTIQLLSS